MPQPYSSSFKDRMVRRLVGRDAVSATALSSEVGVSQATLSRWLKNAGNVPSMTKSRNGPRPPSRKQWTASEKLRAIVDAAALPDKELGEFLRREGLHEADLKRWRETAEAALGGDSREKIQKVADARRMKELERELRRKEKALAETAALLVLKKKVQEIWGDEDDGTAGRSEQ
jgi:transposase